MKNLTCIVCPMGCQLKVDKIDNEFNVEGNKCKRGFKYAVDEMTDPKRVITTTVRLDGAYLNLLPVKTEEAIPKLKMFEIMEVLDKVVVKAPVKVGDIIVENVLGTGVNIVSAKSIELEKSLANKELACAKEETATAC